MTPLAGAHEGNSLYITALFGVSFGVCQFSNLYYVSLMTQTFTHKKGRSWNITILEAEPVECNFVASQT